MKFVALVSGGKDSIYSILQCLRLGHELVACVHLGRPLEEQEESYMYQTAASEVLTVLVEECIGVPLILHIRKGQSVNTSLVYQEEVSSQQLDEVEDLYQALLTAKQRFPEIQAVSSGAILSTYQRVRIENVCTRLDLKSLSFLWRAATQHDILQNMLDDGMQAVLVRTAAPPGLIPRRHLNKTLNQLQGHFLSMHDKYQFHVCGEGGEYETIVLDCPGVYQKRLVLDEVEIIELDGDDGVGDLRIIACHAEAKDDTTTTVALESKDTLENGDSSYPYPSSKPAKTIATDEKIAVVRKSPNLFLPRERRVQGGLWHVSEIMSPVPATDLQGECPEADLAVQEALAVFTLLEKALRRHNCAAQDVMMVHLYLSEISHFGAINAHYRKVFGVLLPPSRSCIAVGKSVLPGGRRIVLDCMIQSGSGQYMRPSASSTSNTATARDNPYTQAALKTNTSFLRQVLHVQSLSHWAPVCVGPYSQVNTLRSGLHFLAGQIGLKPANMTLHETWKQQLGQTWTNVARVLDALDGGSLDNMLSCLLYVADPIFFKESSVATIASICCDQIESNGGVTPGAVDNLRLQGAELDGYEDEETMMELTDDIDKKKTPCPILLVSIPEMPVGAVVEVEVIAATRKAASCLEMQESSAKHACPAVYVSDEVGSLGWDTCHDVIPRSATTDEVKIDVLIRFLGNRSAASAIVTASTPTSESCVDMDVENVLSQMVHHFSRALRYGLSGLGLANALNVRLYYVSTSRNDLGELTAVESDGVRIRSAFQHALAAQWPSAETVPATTLIPVQGLTVLNLGTSADSRTLTFFAMQIVLVDPVHMESEIWIHHGREKE